MTEQQQRQESTVDVIMLDANPTHASTSAATAASSSSSSSAPLIHDRLTTSFSGATLDELEELGVSAFDSSEVERNILAEALAAAGGGESGQQEEKKVEEERRPSTQRIPSRPPIPKKSSLGGSTTLAAPRPIRARERDLVHPTERAPPPASKKGRGGGRALGGRGSSKDSSAPNRHAAADSILDRATASGMGATDSDDQSYRERQHLIATGQMTPFGSVSSGVQMQPQPVIHSKPFSSTNSAATPSPTKSSSPFPSSLQQSHPPSSISTSKKKPALTKAKTTSSSASIKKKAGGKRRRTTESENDEDDEEVAAVVSESTPSKRSKKSASSNQAWVCSACTFLNPSDFVARCEMCHTIRPRNATVTVAATDASSAASSIAPAVKLEEGEIKIKVEPRGSPIKSKYIELSSDDDEENKRTVKKEKSTNASAFDDESDGDEAYDNKDEKEDEEDEDDADPITSALHSESHLIDIEDDEEDVLDDDLVEDVASHRSRTRAMYDDYEAWRYDERVEAFRQHQATIAEAESARAASASSAVVGSAPAPSTSDTFDVVFEGGFIIPAYIWNRLFSYQKTCIKWLWELHGQRVGGIIADEMGLGKTIQLIAFLSGLHYSAMHQSSSASASSSSSSSSFRSLGPTLLIVPATIMSQWLREFHEWYPAMRVFILHDSIPHPTGVTKRDIVNKAFEASAAYSSDDNSRRGHNGCILITTYQSVRGCKHLLLNREWGYVVLDEGHKIKSPDASITLLVKQFLSVHRLILTGSPIQNSLIELWSLFDFIFPGKLGTLPVFEDEFCLPIQQGGYTSATPVQIALAYKCALILRDLINPYILRRSKADVAQHLPPKTEQVLFCNLTPTQHQIYKRFLEAHAKDINEIVEGKSSLFRVIHYLRKIANHADLLELAVQGKKKQDDVTGRNRNRRSRHDDDDMVGVARVSAADYGSIERSGKMKVLDRVLKLWHEQKHRCLIFAQTRQMLDILEKYVKKEGYTYRRIDGSTSIKQRLPYIDEFNTDPNIFIMLLTTRAGGLGVNLTGADRVVLYDPDWNPSSDAQAKERAYRIGQTKSVTVYRLILKGCIEEKVYHRQIWKQFLTDKILRDPKQKRFFSNHDIKDLFSLAPLHATNNKYNSSSNSASLRAGALAKNETAGIFKSSVINHSDVLEQQERERQLKEEKNTKTEADATMKTELEDGEIPPLEPLVPSMEEKKEEESIPLHIEPYKEDEEAKNHAQSTADDNRILAALFSGEGGIQTALDHDAVLGSSSRQEKTVLANFASKAADRAVAALKKSRQAMKHAPVNAPTWTGRSGVTGAPSDIVAQPRFGTTVRKPLGIGATTTNGATATTGEDVLAEARLRPAAVDTETSASSSRHFDSTAAGFSSGTSRTVIGSQGLLARMRERGHVSSAMASHTGVSDAAMMDLDAAGSNSHTAASAAATHSTDLAEALRASLASHPDGLTSTELVDIFASQIGTLESEKLIFRQVLRRVAVLVGKRKGNPGKWRLKEEFE